MLLISLHRLHLGAPTILLLVGLAALFVALQGKFVRRVIKALLPPSFAQLDRELHPPTSSLLPAPPSIDGVPPASPEGNGTAPSVPPPA